MEQEKARRMHGELKTYRKWKFTAAYCHREAERMMIELLGEELGEKLAKAAQVPAKPRTVNAH